MYQLRSIKPMDSPGWWNADQCQKHFAGVTTDALRARLNWLYDNPPPDTGVEPGKPREWHCGNMVSPCPLCEAWINWGDETAAVSKELRRRQRHGEWS